MKKFLIILTCFFAVIVAIFFFSEHETVHLRYNCDTYGIDYIVVGSGINLKGYSNLKFQGGTLISDKRVIGEIFGYLNSIPLIPTQNNADLGENNRRDAIIDLYNEKGLCIGWISFHGEQHILTSLHSNSVYTARDKGTSIVLGLEALDLSM